MRLAKGPQHSDTGEARTGGLSVSSQAHCHCAPYTSQDLNPVYFSSLFCTQGNFSCFCCCLLTFFKNNFCKKLFQEHCQSVKGFGSRSGSKLFEKFISGQQRLLARKLKQVLPATRIQSPLYIQIYVKKHKLP